MVPPFQTSSGLAPHRLPSLQPPSPPTISFHVPAMQPLSPPRCTSQQWPPHQPGTQNPIPPHSGHSLPRQGMPPPLPCPLPSTHLQGSHHCRLNRVSPASKCHQPCCAPPPRPSTPPHPTRRSGRPREDQTREKQLNPPPPPTHTHRHIYTQSPSAHTCKAATTVGPTALHQPAKATASFWNAKLSHTSGANCAPPLPPPPLPPPPAAGAARPPPLLPAAAAADGGRRCCCCCKRGSWNLRVSTSGASSNGFWVWLIVCAGVAGRGGGGWRGVRSFGLGWVGRG